MKLFFRCTGFLREDHGQPIFGVSVNHHLGPDQPLVFATVGNNRVTIYEGLQNGKEAYLAVFYIPNQVGF